MADIITIPSGTSGQYKAHPEGQYTAVCVDVIDLGERPESFKDQPAKLKQKAAFVFRTGEVNAETGRPFDITAEYTVSMDRRSGLRQLLEAWRGKSYDEDYPKPPLHLLEGQAGLVSVEHKTSPSSGRTYAKIKTIAPLPKQMPKPETGEYTRADYWGTRKAEYAEAAAKWREAHLPPAAESIDDFPAALDDDDSSLPF